jgi:hypothetical protein
MKNNNQVLPPFQITCCFDFLDTFYLEKSNQQVIGTEGVYNYH